MTDTPSYPLRVLYDGGCSVCSRAIGQYGRRAPAGQLELIDIHAADFSAEEYGFSMAELLYQLHAVDERGRVFRGVEALRAIWQAFPPGSGYGLLGRLASSALIRPFARLGYWCFARLRHFLPPAQTSCRFGQGAPQ